MVWVFSSLTAVALAHLIDAVSATILGGESRLLGLYPFIGERLRTLAPQTYFWAAVGATFLLWGITCAVAFENPVEAFLNKILCDAKRQSASETKAAALKGEHLDMIYTTIGTTNKYLT